MELVMKVLPALLEGTKTTMQVFCLTFIMSLPLGIMLGLGAVSRFKPLSVLVSTFNWVIRGTPLLLQMIFVFFGLPFLGIVIQNRLAAVLIAFVINYMAYFAEIFRGGIQAIPQGQYEAAKVLGLSKIQTIRKIVIPQVVKIVFPSIGNEIITLVKDTSLVYAVGLSEVMKAGRIAMQREASIAPLLVVAVIYLVLTGLVTIVLKLIEKKLSYYN
ncbi:amino acid ABC transporter permease [Vagococcus acidifermentans]|uniref:Amino acid ABC transporter permease n=1 Tax=Vagococcus acidifermentans TaxID=564710 RepID=A0A430ARC8_9ENTE|nr:amino acid ABC transporter permease [Vagococcus acidifermentans]RSU10613.1 amino acid ABC transporter permease [Vagococcus acidifermentans]